MNQKIKSTKLFLDSVIMSEIEKYSWLVSGVTTTPTFFKREGIDYSAFVQQFRTSFPDLELHIEALGKNSAETEAEIVKIMKESWYDPKKVVLKIPASNENLKLVSKYSKMGVAFNTHLVFTANQAYLATVCGTTYVCPLIGRYADNQSQLLGKNLHGGEQDVGQDLLRQVMEAVSAVPGENTTKVMASSIRTLGDMAGSILAGADIVTVPTKILDQSFDHTYTSDGIKTFLKDMGLLEA